VFRRLVQAPHTSHLTSHYIHFPFKLYSEFSFYRLQYLLTQIKYFLPGCISIIHQHEGLPCMTTCITAAETFPAYILLWSCILDQPAGSKLDATIGLRVTRQPGMGTGQALGEVRHIAEAEIGGGGMPRRMMAMAAADSGGGMPVDGGEGSVNAVVTVTWALGPSV